MVDTLGLLVGVHVHPANIHDLPGGLATLERITVHPPKVLFADSAYEGDSIRIWLAEHGGGRLDIVRRPPCSGLVTPGNTLPTRQGFQVLAKRWVVERTHAWVGRNRRMSKDYEGLAATTEAWEYLAMAALMARRLARGDF